MSDPVLTTEHITQLVHRCIIELQNKNTRLLVDLSSLLHSLAQATGDDVYRVLASPLGGFAGELMSFRSLVAVPILPTETREKCEGMLDNAIKGGLEALEIVKNELQKGEARDYKEIVRAVALLTENDYALYGERSALTRASSRSMPDTD